LPAVASAKAPLTRRSQLRAIDELGLGEALAAVVLAGGHVVGPAQDPFLIPGEVGNAGMNPIEGEVRVDAEQRDLIRRVEPAAARRKGSSMIRALGGVLGIPV